MVRGERAGPLKAPDGAEEGAESQEGARGLSPPAPSRGVHQEASEARAVSVSVSKVLETESSLYLKSLVCIPLE